MHRDGTAARGEKRMIVLGVADTDDVLGSDAHLPECGEQTGGLVYTRRQYHHRALVEDELEFEPELFNRGQNRVPMIVRGGDDHAPFDKRGDTAAPEQLCQRRMGSIGEASLGRSCGRIQNCAVFYHSGFEEMELWEDVQQLFEAVR